MTSWATRAHPLLALTRSRPALTQRLRPARRLVQHLPSLQLFGEQRRLCGQRDHSSPQLLRKSMGLLADVLLRLVGTTAGLTSEARRPYGRQCG